MPSLSAHPTRSVVKLLAFGDSKSGKTGSLVSLVAADYKLFILDLDNLLGILRRKVLEVCPDKIKNVHFASFSDKYKVGNVAVKEGVIFDGRPMAWLNSLRMLNQWKDGDEDFGDPASWPDDHILVIDSLSRWCDVALNFHESVNQNPDGRSTYKNAQDDVEKQISSLTSPLFPVNLIVIGHGVYLDLDDGTRRILPQGVGAKLSPKIPTYFPNVVYYRNKSDKRTIQLESDRMVNLANDAALAGELPIETGLATIFAALRGQPSEPATKPTTLRTLKVKA